MFGNYKLTFQNLIFFIFYHLEMESYIIFHTREKQIFVYFCCNWYVAILEADVFRNKLRIFKINKGYKTKMSFKGIRGRIIK